MRAHVAAMVVLATIGSGFVPGPSALAATVTVEAENQLRIDVKPSGGWTVNQFRNLVEVRFPGLGEDLLPDASIMAQVGALVREVEAERIGNDTVLRITMACSCKVAVLGEGPDSVIVSIIDPEPVQDSGRAISIVSVRADPFRSPRPVRKPSRSDEASSPPDKLDPAMVTERLVEQLRRAAKAGIVELDPEQTLIPAVDLAAPSALEGEPSTLPKGVEIAEDAQEEARAVVDEPLASEQPPDMAAQVRKSNAEVVADLEKPPATVPEVKIAKCFGDENFRLEETAGPSQFIEALRTHRRALVGEFDASDAAAATALARTYLAHGLADEAIAVISEFVPTDDQSDVIAEMGSTLLNAADNTILHLRLADCVGDQAIWRAYIHAVNGAYPKALAAEAVSGRALERLPKPLRERIGARIGHAAANLGDWETARRMEAMITRARRVLGRRSGDSLLLSARLAEWHEEPERAWDLRQQARAAGPPYGDRALLELSRTVLESPTFLRADTRDLEQELGALSREARNTPEGAAAFELEARLAARRAGRESVVDLLTEGVRTGVLKPDERVALLSELLSEPSMSELSRPVGLIYLEQPEVFEQSLEQTGFRHAVIRSLSALGLPYLADPLLRGGDRKDDNLMQALVPAHLESGDPRQALDLARGLQDGRVRDMLMAAALSANGNGARAMRYLSAAPATSQPDDPVDLLALELAFGSAMENGDLAAAKIAGQQILSRRPTKGLAEQIAMLALMQGSREMPSSVAQVLEDVSPQRRRELQMLFAPVPGIDNLEDAAATAGLLNRMDVEIGLLEGLLAGG